MTPSFSINQVKRHNILSVKRALISLDGGTKNDVARVTGLSVATCGTILNELEGSGEILQAEGGPSSFGRPPKLYRFNENRTYICCILLTKHDQRKVIHCAVMNLLGELVYERSEHFDLLGIDEIADCLQGLLEQFPKISVISIGTPGYYFGGRIHSSGLPELEGQDPVRELKERFGREVLVENDMNAMAFGIYFYRRDLVKPEENMVLIAMMKTNHLSSASIIGGEILRGFSSFAGEILHLNYPGGDPKKLLARDHEGVLHVASVAVESYISIVNPAVIVFTGSSILESDLSLIREAVLSHIPPVHIPAMVYVENFMRSHMQGLCAITVHTLELA